MYPTVDGLSEFYSRTMANDACELFVDKWENPTTSYPHVHIVHHGGGTWTSSPAELPLTIRGAPNCTTRMATR
jgi:hypothetical protein